VTVQWQRGISLGGASWCCRIPVLHLQHGSTARACPSGTRVRAAILWSETRRGQAVQARPHNQPPGLTRGGRLARISTESTGPALPGRDVGTA
jgi:hypothetical protein